MQKTVRYVVIAVLGSAAVVALLSLVLIGVARSILPAPAPSSSQAASTPEEPPDEPTAATPDGPEPASAPAGDLQKCCAALAQNARSAPPDQQALYLQAAGLCDALKSSPQGTASFRAVRAALRGVTLPKSCR